MAAEKLYSDETFVTKLRSLHGDKFDYSKVTYTSLRGRVILTCPEHGDFTAEARAILKPNAECPACSGAYRWMTKDYFLNRLTLKHGTKFEVIEVPEIVKYSTDVILHCKSHGQFTIKAGPLLTTLVYACPHCANVARSLSVSRSRRKQEKFRMDKLELLEELNEELQRLAVKPPSEDSPAALLRKMVPTRTP